MLGFGQKQPDVTSTLANGSGESNDSRADNIPTAATAGTTGTKNGGGGGGGGRGRGSGVRCSDAGSGSARDHRVNGGTDDGPLTLDLPVVKRRSVTEHIVQRAT
jgi:hypothetical protein